MSTPRHAAWGPHREPPSRTRCVSRKSHACLCQRFAPDLCDPERIDSLPEMRGYVALLLLLAAIWGASFMFIKIAVDELAPTTTMALRLVFSAFPLLAIVFVKRGIRPATVEMRSIVVPAMVLGVVQHRGAVHAHRLGRDEDRLRAWRRSATPRCRSSWHCSRSASARTERATGAPVRRALLGLIGVAVLAGVDPKGGWAGFVGTLAVVAASDLVRGCHASTRRACSTRCTTTCSPPSR